MASSMELRAWACMHMHVGGRHGNTKHQAGWPRLGAGTVQKHDLRAFKSYLKIQPDDPIAKPTI